MPERTRPLGGFRAGDAAALSALALLCAIYFIPLWNFNQAWCGMDFSSQVLPLYHWLHLKYAAGQAPLWCDQLSAGRPVIDGSISAYFYPPRRLLLSFFDAIPALALDTALHTYLAGLGAYLFCRLRGLGALPASLAALVSCFGGGMCYAQHAPWVLSDLAWMPWQFLGLELALRKGGALAGAALLGIATGFSCSGGHPTFILLAGSLLLLYALVRAWPQPGIWPKVPGIAALLGLLVALMTWGHFRTSLRGLSQSLRLSSYSVGEAGLNELSPASLIHPILPYAYGDPRDGTFLGMNWPGGSWIHQGLFLYVSLAALLLALYGAWRKPQARLMLSLAGLLLLLSLGQHLPFFGMLHALPGFSRVRAPGKWLILATFPMGAAAAWGLDALLESPRGARAWALGALALALLLGGLWVDSFIQGESWVHLGMNWMQGHLAGRADAPQQLEIWGQALEALKKRLQGHLEMQAIFMAATAGLFYLSATWKQKPLLGFLWLAVCVADLFINTFAYFPVTAAQVYTQMPPALALIQSREKDPGAFRFFGWGGFELESAAESSGWAPGAPQRESITQEMVPGEMPVYFSFSSLRGYPGLDFFRSSLILDGLRDTSYFPKPGQREGALLARRQLLDRGAVRYLFSPNALKQAGLENIGRAGHLSVYLNHDAKPLAWAASEALGVPSPQSALAAVLAEPLASTRTFVEKGRSGASDAGAQLLWQQRGDDGWQLEIRAKKDVFVVLSRMPYRGLNHASVDGREVPWQEADGAYCGAWVPAGKHLLRMEARDPLLGRDMALSWAGLGLGLLLLGWGFWAPRFSRKQ